MEKEINEKKEVKDTKEQSTEKLNTKSINDLVKLAKNFLNLLYIIIIIIGVLLVIQILSTLKIVDIILSVLGVLAPLFIGLLIAWLFYPLVKKLEKRGMKKGVATTIVYAIFLGIIALILFAIVPLLYNQVMELVSQLPSIGSSIQDWITNLFSRIEDVPGLDVEAAKLSLLEKINLFGKGLTDSLPTTVVSIVSSLFSGLGTFGLGLVLGFFILAGVDNPLEAVKDLLPRKAQKHFIDIAERINTTCRNFINGALIDSLVVFIISTIALWIVGLKSPILFGLFCGITNIIPYAGPYIGGAPAVIVGFSQSPLTGILCLVAIAIIQGIEGNFFQPMIMSKTTKLHPVTILLGLLIFGHYWGMVGMIIATPVIGAIKAVIVYFDEKYSILDFKK